MDEITKIEIENIKHRVDKLETKTEHNEKKINEFDKTQEVLITQLENIRLQLERVEKKTDKLLGHTGDDVLNEDKAKKWDKMVWLVIGEAIAIFGLVLKVFVGL